jgi:hypothetical protein
MKPFEIELSPRGADTFAIPQSDSIYVLALEAATAASMSVPAGAKTVFFSCVDADGAQAPFFAKFNDTATIAAADVEDGTASEPNPVHRSLYGVTSISCISPAASFVYLMFYS